MWAWTDVKESIFSSEFYDPEISESIFVEEVHLQFCDYCGN